MIDRYIKNLIISIDKINQQDIIDVANLIKKTTDLGHNIFVFGNGGSATTASHFAQDMNKMLNCRFISLNDNISSLLAYGNDIGFESIFELQLSNLINKGDLVIGFSCSGQSKNVLNAINLAKNFGCRTIGFTGFNGGELKKIADENLHVPFDDMQICEDCHLILTHIILRLINEQQ
jgi:D-sedoheptulose 7-phosphate isomerase